MDSTDNSGGRRRLKGKLTSLPATKQNNRLAANLLALKLNILASDLGITPRGFGDLRIVPDIPPPGVPGCDPGCYWRTWPLPAHCECNGDWSIWRLAHFTDSLMTYWDDVPKETYWKLDSVISRVNDAFAKDLANGRFAPEDISEWLKHGQYGDLKLRGSKSLSEVPFLKEGGYQAAPVSHPKMDPIESGLPDQFSLDQNYPNPFNPTTTIQFTLPQQAFVTLKVYNTLGQEVAKLVDHEMMEDGTQEVEFDASSLTSGVYLYRIVAEGIGDDEGIPQSGRERFMSVKKMLLLK